ncbi:MAG: T9SS type A sorting domain-containing protein [Bacteroidales bacterium]|nr:T9SS type A sorting domain-containing protein [Bacteroidales bacterium]
MKTFTFLASFTLAATVMQAQDYQIDFTASGASTSVDSVYVENLTQGTTLSISGDDILNLVSGLGINSITADIDNMRLYPNPMIETTRLEYDNLHSGLVRIEIINETGILVVGQSLTLQRGVQKFEINNLSAGVYSVMVVASERSYSSKLIALGNSSGNPEIRHRGSSEISQNKDLKNTTELIQMAYDEGEMILFKGFSGDHTVVYTLLPTQSQTVNFEFVACTDEDENNYSVVTIGTQTWMAKNMKTTTYNNGNGIPLVTDRDEWRDLNTAAYCWYENDEAFFGVSYGALYNWFAVNTGMLCPTGWHVPTDADWTILTDFLGGDGIAGGKLKETGIFHWEDPNTGATNESGFTALPGGIRKDNGNFEAVNEEGSWWSASQSGGDDAWFRLLASENEGVERDDDEKISGLSVRCIKD